MKNALGTRVANIKVQMGLECWIFVWFSYERDLRVTLFLQLTPRLDTHPAMITVLEMGAARHFLRTQQLARSAEERAQILQPTLEINAG